MSYPDLAGGHFQGGKQSAGAVSFVAVAKSVESPAVGQAQPALRSLQDLNMRLLIDAEHNRVFRWTQVQTDYIRRLRTEFRIGGNAPTAPPLELHLMFAQHPPNLIVTDLPQFLGE